MKKMSTMSPHNQHSLLYICQDGNGPSGVATYGFTVLKHQPGARMLLLNADRLPDMPGEIIDRITILPGNLSHDPSAVAMAIRECIDTMLGPIAILPNTGDTPWSATAAYLKGATVQERMRVRVLGIIHSDTDTQYRIARDYASMAPVWIGVSRRCCEELKKHLRDSGSVVQLLHYPIDVQYQRRSLDGSSPLRIAYVGRLEETQKRISRLPLLFSELTHMGIDYRATVVGGGPHAAVLRDSLQGDAATEFASRVDFRGELSSAQVGEIWRTHDIFLLVSSFEGLPISMLEAMAAGACPVTMAVDSGISDVLEDGRNARVVAQGDIKAMAAAIASLNANRDFLARLGRAAQQTIEARFATSPHFDRLKKILDQSCENPPVGDSLQVFDGTDGALRRLLSAVKARTGAVAIYGSGMFGRKVVDACLKAGAPVCALFDSDAARFGMIYRHLECEPPEHVVKYPKAVFVAGSLQFSEEIAERIRNEFLAAGLGEPEVLVTKL
jgi:glycosyltransferase involved in cell wall biosynthesis